MTDEEMNAMITGLDTISGLRGMDAEIIQNARAAITTLHAQLAEAKKGRCDMHRRAQKAEGKNQRSVALLNMVLPKIRSVIPLLPTLPDPYPLSLHELYWKIKAAKDHARNGSGRAQMIHWSYYGEQYKREKARADLAEQRVANLEAALAAQIEVDARIADTKTDVWDGGYSIMAMSAKKAAEDIAATIRNQPRDRTALDRHDAKTREKALREAAQACDWGDIYGDNAVRTILALIEKPNAR